MNDEVLMVFKNAIIDNFVFHYYDNLVAPTCWIIGLCAACKKAAKYSTRYIEVIFASSNIAECVDWWSVFCTKLMSTTKRYA